VAWGGNWFFLTDEHPFTLNLEHEEQMTAFAGRVRQALEANAITGAKDAEIDHIELFSAAHNPANQSRNFVLCPGLAYDRSPCGTGTSAKMACLVADGRLAPGQLWRQEGILDSVFTGRVELDGDRILPYITGSAYVTSEASLIFHANDPFRGGIPSGNGKRQ
jgi:4-hydroxyproline epimerase